jgi:hypothetical protein
VVGDADVVAVGEDLLAFREVRRRGFHHLAGQVDARHEAVQPGDAAVRGDGERVLVVHARPRHADRDVTLPQLVAREVGDAALHLVAALLGDEGSKRLRDAAAAHEA